MSHTRCLHTRPAASRAIAGGECELGPDLGYRRPTRTIESRERRHASKSLNAAEGKHENLRMPVVNQSIRRSKARNRRTQADTLVKTRTLNGPSLSLAMGGALRSKAKGRRKSGSTYGVYSG